MRQNRGSQLRIITAAVCALLTLALAMVSPARADVIKSYQFTGALTVPFGGTDAVSGQFTLDLSNQTITTYNFVTPVATYNPATDLQTARISQYTPAVNPAADFVEFIFRSSNSYFMDLIFQTEFANFPGNNFDTQGVSLGSAGIKSGISCVSCGPLPGQDFPPPDGTGADFASGSATLISPVPEPGTLALFGIGSIAIGFIRGRRFQSGRARSSATV